MKTLRHITAGFLLLGVLAACGSPAIKDYGAHSEQGAGDHSSEAGTGAATPAAEGGDHNSGPATQSAEQAASEPATPAVPAASTAPATQSAAPEAAAATAAATAAQQTGASVTAVTGRATYIQRIALPAGAVMVVRIEDVSVTDKANAAIAEETYKLDDKTPPFNFSVQYDPARVNPANRYAVSIMIQEAGGKVRFLNTTMQPVITLGARTDVGEVVLSDNN